MELADANYYTGWTRSYYIAQGAIFNILRKTLIGKNMKKKVHIHKHTHTYKSIYICV